MDNATQTLDTIISNEPLVSILMLTYNRKCYITEAIRSVIDQTYTNWELIIIDDGSTDETAGLISQINESRIRYIRHAENVGLYTRRKESLQYVKGEYVAILDSDDLWIESKKIAEQVAFLEAQQECVVVGTYTKLINEAGETIGESRFQTGDISIREHILLRNQFTHSSVLMRTVALRKTNGYQPTLAEDLELFLQLGHYGNFANLPILATAHRVHHGSANDHGINMCSGVHSIILSHASYPRFKLAWCQSHARLLICRLKKLLQKR